MKSSISIDGLRELDEALKELPRATGKNIMRRAARKALEPVIANAKTLVPVDDGALKRSLKVATKLSKRQQSLARTTEGKASISVYAGAASLPQAHLVEYGSSRQGAQPFLRPAWDSGRAKVLSDFQKTMWSEIEKAAKRLARKAAKDAAKGA